MRSRARLRCAGMKFELQELPLMIHPPFDQEVGDTQIIHYTYGIELMANGSNAFPDKARFDSPQPVSERHILL